MIGNTGKDVIKLMISNPSDPIDIVKEKGWLKINDIDQLSGLCKELIEKNAEKVSCDYVEQQLNFIHFVFHFEFVRPSLYKMEIQSYSNGLLGKQWVVQEEWLILLH